MHSESPDDLRFADLSTALLVWRLGSVTASARQLGVTPSQVSKAVARLERHLGTILFNRSSRGVTLTEEGRRRVPLLDDVATRLRAVLRADEHAGAVLTLAAPSYMNSLLPVIADAIPDSRVRSLELPPPLVRTLAPANLFDATLLLGPPRLPMTWTATQIGKARKTLFASPRVARRLGRPPIAMELLREFPIVSPVHNVGGQYIPVDDDCPLPASLRRPGHEAQTIGAALDLAARTGQLVYGPAFAALRHVAEESLVEVRVRGWNAHDPVYLGCNADRILARVQKIMIATLQRAVASLEQRACWRGSARRR